MKIIVSDTETSGLPVWNEPSEGDSQPHIVQLAALLIEDSGDVIVLREMNRIVRPDGWRWDDESEAFKAHGISYERAMDEGVPEHEAIAEFYAMQAQADMRVAHNTSFDDRIYRIGFKRYGHGGEGHRDLLQDDRDVIADAFKVRPSFCTMKATTGVLCLPPTEKMKAARFTKYKPPKLTEAFAHYFGFTFDGAHDAMNDAKACADVFYAIQRHITTPIFTAAREAA